MNGNTIFEMYPECRAAWGGVGGIFSAEVRTKWDLKISLALVVGTQKNRLNEHPKHMFKEMVKKIFTISC